MRETEERARRWVWRSTEESVREGRISLLAVAEIPLALVLYFYIVPQAFGYWTPVIVSAIAAPLLLLRSDASVRMAVEMWRRYAERPDDDRLAWWEWALILAGSVVISGGAAWWLSEIWLAPHEGWSLFWRAFFVGVLCVNIGFAVGVAVAGAILFMGGILLGAWARSVLIRAASIFRNLSEDCASIGSNWRRAMLCEDLRHQPELIPSARSLRLDLRGANELASETTWAELAMPLGYPLAILWRLALKSTFWFYGPAVFVVHLGALADRATREKCLSRDKTAWERLVFWTALVLFSVTVLTLLDPGQLSELWRESQAAGVPFDLLTWSLALDMDALLSQPWRWFSLANLLCALAVFFWRDAIAKRVRNGEKVAMRGWPVGWLVRLARAQILFFLGYWLLSIRYFVPFMIESGRAPGWLIANWPY